MQRIMDAISNQLFSFELGVQPNKDTFQGLAGIVNKGCEYLHWLSIVAWTDVHSSQ